MNQAEPAPTCACTVPGKKNSGRCHSAQTAPSASAAVRGPSCSCRRGRAQPRQPGSPDGPAPAECEEIEEHDGDGASLCRPRPHLFHPVLREAGRGEPPSRGGSAPAQTAESPRRRLPTRFPRAWEHSDADAIGASRRFPAFPRQRSVSAEKSADSRIVWIQVLRRIREFANFAEWPPVSSGSAARKKRPIPERPTFSGQPVGVLRYSSLTRCASRNSRISGNVSGGG